MSNFLVTHTVPLAPLTTLKVGGSARYYTIASTDADVKMAVHFAKQNELPFFILGGGSNVLINDNGYDGLIIHMQSRGYTYQDSNPSQVLVTVEAGEILDSFIASTVREGWWGLENLSHIPGTVGATPVQNVGAYGVEVAHCIDRVTIYNTYTNTVESLTREQCLFSYRDSIFKQKVGRDYIILRVTFMLSKIPVRNLEYADLKHKFNDFNTPDQTQIRAAVIAIRSTKFPDWSVVGTAGSFFKNPVVAKEIADALSTVYPELPVYPVDSTTTKLSLGFILDKICHLKGMKKKHVRLYEKQVLVLVAEDGATATEIESFAREVQQKVLLDTKVFISFEVMQL